MDGRAHPVRDGARISGVEFGVQMQERKAVHERPDRGGEGIRVCCRKGALDDGRDVGRDRRGCRDAGRPADERTPSREAYFLDLAGDSRQRALCR